MKRILSFFAITAILLGTFAFHIPDNTPIVLAVETTETTATETVEPTEPPEPKLIAFTFDDGPGFYTDDLLDGLAERGAKATFFVNGENGSALGAAFHTDLLKRMANEGHQIANHTYSHYVPFDELPASSIASQVEGVNTYLYNAMGGKYQTLVRTPGGANSEDIRENVTSPIILWSLDTLDWKNRNVETIYDNIVTKARNGAVVLLHDIYSTSVEGALQAITELQKQGYECVTVSELFRRRGMTLENGTVYNGATDSELMLPPYGTPTITDTLNTTNGKANITLSTDEAGLTLYYTTDGSTPTLGSTKYTAPFTVPYGKTVRVAGFDAFGTRTPVVSKTLDQSYEGVFDATYYANRYPDLKKTYGTNESALRNHFLNFGIHEGRQGAVTFNADYYMMCHPEIQRFLDNDPTRNMLYFLTKGMAAGHRGSAEFDPASYRLYYPDLRLLYGDDWKAYYAHYLRTGQLEKRTPTGYKVMRNPTTIYEGVDYAAVYDFSYYVTRHSDIKKNFFFNDTAALEHFVTVGMNEGRVGSEQFRVQLYKSTYEDLQQRFGDDLKAYYTHYLEAGLKEGRTGQ